jgi:hypothetical protein
MRPKPEVKSNNPILRFFEKLDLQLWIWTKAINDDTERRTGKKR